MDLTPDSNEFWDRVDREMRIKQPSTWRFTKWMLRLGISTVLFSASYLLFLTLLTPAKGYFITRHELVLDPIFWALAGAVLIIGGAYLRFRAMGPIVEHFKRHGFD